MNHEQDLQGAESSEFQSRPRRLQDSEPHQPRRFLPAGTQWNTIDHGNVSAGSALVYVVVAVSSNQLC